jgi:hypothetical protein
MEIVMRRTFFVGGATILGLVLLVSAAISQDTTMMRGRGAGPMRMGRMAKGSPMMYDLKTVETDSGEVATLDTVSSGTMPPGVHLTLTMGKENLGVHLGPAWYLSKQDVRIRPGDRIVVTGSRISFRGSPALIAAEIRNGKGVLKLRDAAGFPLWSRRRN